MSAKTTLLEPVLSKREPGLLVSSPSKVSGDRSNLSYSRGSSNSTALASRQAAGYLDLIEELRKEPEGKLLSAEFTAVLLKAMLVHGAYWDEAASRFMNVLRNPSNSRKIREHLARFVGYGSPTNTRMLRAADHRATLVGCGKLMNDEIAEFQFPLPEDLGGKHCWRQLVLTLAWLTPINAMHRSYRGVALNFSPPMDQLLIKRKDVDWRAVQRGTVQHEVLIGSKATAFKRGESLSIQVECRAEALSEAPAIPFAVIATLEADEKEAVRVWDGVNEILVELRDRVRI